MAITLKGSGQTIVQVVQAVKTDVFSATTSTATDITGMSASITPSSASNKILVSVNMTYGTDNDGYPRITLLRNGTGIYIGDASGTCSRVSIPMNNVVQSSVMLTTAQMLYLDSPATTSAVTYKLQVATYLGRNFYLNRSVSNSDANANCMSAPSSITLMEVAYA